MDDHRRCGRVAFDTERRRTISFALAALGASLAAPVLAQKTGTDLTFVPFKGALADPAYRRSLETFDLDDAYLSGEDYFKLASRLWVEEKKNLEMLGMKPQ